MYARGFGRVKAFAFASSDGILFVTAMYDIVQILEVNRSEVSMMNATENCVVFVQELQQKCCTNIRFLRTTVLKEIPEDGLIHGEKLFLRTTMFLYGITIDENQSLITMLFRRVLE